MLATSRHQAAALSRRLSRIPGLPVHTQTDGGARGDLLERFKATGGVLVGLASFWEGVDLPGELLEVVCVLKLPFLVPSAPVVAARSQRLARVGEDPFETMFVPDVVLRLRQGIGRLIRTGSDRGAVILLDRRLVTAPYAVDGEILGVLGVIGPTRMAYDRVIPIVDATARLLGAALNQKE